MMQGFKYSGNIISEKIILLKQQTCNNDRQKQSHLGAVYPQAVFTNKYTYPRGVVDTIHQDAMCVAQSTVSNLMERQRVAEEKANTLITSVKNIHQSEKDPNFARAESRMVGIITFYRSKEQATQAKILQEESAVIPTDMDQWSDQLAKRKVNLPTILAPTPGPLNKETETHHRSSRSPTSPSSPTT